MTSSQPYLIRAIYEWIVDNDLTPYLMVDATRKGTIVPEDYLDEKGMIILNISPTATSELLMSNEEVTFNARFSGQAICIVVPVYSVKAIYARENGQGMMFDGEGTEHPGTEDTAAKGKTRVSLEAVGGAQTDGGTDKEKNGNPDDKPPGNNPDSKGGRKKGPNLKVVK